MFMIYLNLVYIKITQLHEKKLIKIIDNDLIEIHVDQNLASGLGTIKLKDSHGEIYELKDTTTTKLTVNTIYTLYFKS